MKRAIIIVILIFLLSGCDTYAMLEMYPYDRADVWYCEEIDATIDFSAENSVLDTNFSWNGDTYFCAAALQSTYICFIFDANGNGIIDSPEEKILEGIWKYKNKKMVIEITDSNLFGDAFSELIFAPVYGE